MIKFPDSIHYGKEHRAAAGGHKPAFWAAAGIFALAALLGADVIWMVFEEGLTLLFEFVAERLEQFFQKTFGLDLYHAQMATAYSGALILVSIGYFLLRKFAAVARHIRVDGRARWREHSAELLGECRARVYRGIAWWSTLDLLNKSAVLVALIVIGIPMTLLLSYGLVAAVAEMF